LDQGRTDRLDPAESLPIEEGTLGIPALDAFAQQGWITRIHSVLTSGKEATVYCCRAHPSTNRKFLAAKVYREHAAQSYRRNSTYFAGRERTMKARTLRAIERGSEFGHQAMAGMWIWAEYDALRRLAAVRASVPRPYAIGNSAILMEYIGNGERPAPRLNGIDLDSLQAAALSEQVVEGIRTLLQAHLVHGDLSPYNILVWKEQAWIIDLPQAVDVRFNPNAFYLLCRDLENVCSFFASCGVCSLSADLARELWESYQRAEL